MRNAITRFAVIAAAATALALNVPTAYALDDAGDDDEETPVAQPRRPDPPREERPAPPRTETRPPREEPRPVIDMDDDIVTFATDRELIGRDTENIFGPDTPMIYLGPAQCMTRSERPHRHRDHHTSMAPHDGFWRNQDQKPVAMVSSFSAR